MPTMFSMVDFYLAHLDGCNTASGPQQHPRSARQSLYLPAEFPG